MNQKENFENNSESIITDDTEMGNITDLSVDEEREEQVKGGLPAVQKVRDAASRIEC